MLDLRHQEPGDLLRRWLSEPRRVHYAGSVFSDTSQINATVNRPLGKSHDALCFLDRNSAALANP